MKKILLLAFLLSFSHCFSQWEPCNNGLTEPLINKISVDGSTLWAGSLMGNIFLSTDNGNNWENKIYGMLNNKFSLLASNNKHIFFLTTTDYFGLCRSTDTTGERWNLLLDDYYRIPAKLSLAVSDSIIWVGTNNHGIICCNLNWSKVKYFDEKNGLPNFPIYALSLKEEKIIAGTWGGGVYLSSDKGNSWNKNNSGLNNLFIYTFLIKDNRIFAGTKGGGIYQSSDNCKSWKAVNDGLGNLIVLSFSKLGNIIFAATGGSGVYMSVDDGKNWIERNYGLTDLRINSIEAKGNKLFAGSSRDGVFCSSDSGRNWIPKNEGLQNLTIGSFTVRGNKIFAGTYGDELFSSTDDGNTWIKNQLWIDGPCGMPISYILTDSDKILVGTEGRGLFLSTNKGDNWEVINKGLDDLHINSIIKYGKTYFVGTEGKGLYSSSEKLDNWNVRDTGIFKDGVLSFAIDGNNFYVGSCNGLFISTDKGVSWISKSNGLSEWCITNIIISNKNIIIGTNYRYSYRGRIFVSTDDGITWIQKCDTFNVHSIIKHGNYCLASQHRKIYLSSNDGLKWIKISSHGGTDICSNSEYLYAVTSPNEYVEGCDGYGIYRAKLSDFDLYIKPDISNINDVFMLVDSTKNIDFSVNGNNPDKLEFIKLSSNYDLIPVDSMKIGGFGENRTLTISPTKKKTGNCRIILKATDGIATDETSFNVTVMKPTEVEENQISSNSMFISPNPATDFLEISCSPSSNHRVNPMVDYQDVVIYNVFGEKVLTTPYLTPSPSPKERGVRIDVSILSSGVYFVKVGEKVGKFVKI